MNNRQKKILEFAQNKPSFKNKEVMVFFNNKYSRETIVRDLTFLFDKNYLEKNGAGAYITYCLSENYEILRIIDVKNYFETPYLDRKIKENFNFEIFKLLSIDIFTKSEKDKLNKLQKDFHKNFSKYNSQTLINKEFERIMIEFSWKSSVIEGNTYSLLNTESLIKNNVIAAGKSREETVMILNHKNIFNESIENKNKLKQLRFSDIEYIHSILTKDLGISKSLRNAPVGITGTKYKPLDNAYQIKEVMESMVNLINNKSFFLEKSFIASILIPYIQIFEDGNKRTSRMTSNAILLAFDSIPLSYRIVDVEEYKKAMILFYEINNISYFKQIFISQFEDAVNNYFK